MLSLAWDAVRGEFAFDGSWRDIYVLGTDMAGCQQMLNGLSGLKGRDFCEREGVTPTAFAHWRKEIRARDARAAAAGPRRGPGGEITWVAAKTGVALLAGVVAYFWAGTGGPEGYEVMVAVAVAAGVWVGLEVLWRGFYRRSSG